ncbi:MAG: hypothetical protein JNJ45_10320 [Chthonomonas sp.]|nr:hypothetical protein [Chthonomonas sp.]
MAEARLTYFGEFSVEAGGERITRFDTQRAAKLVALVGLSRSKRLSRAELADLLWPDDFPDATRLRLRQELARARKALGAHADLLIADGEFVSLAEVTSDRDDLANLLRVPADSPTYGRAVDQLIGMLAGDFLATWSEPWVFAERTQAHAMRREAVLKGATQYLLDGRPQDVVALCTPLAALDPLDETIRMLLVQAFAETGSMTQAMSEFQQLKRALRDQNRALAEESEAVMAGLGSRTVARPAETAGNWRPRPVNLSRTFGRASERELIAQRWAEGHRLVTLLGPGGIGKTHLALDAAADGDGAVGWVPLAELGAADQVPAALLYQAQLFAPDNVDALDVFVRSVGSRPTVLVLDNAEHLMPDLAAIVRRLLESLPGLRLLVTSRVPLGLAGEQQIRIGPLDPTSAGRDLLLDLWRGLRPNLAMTPATESELTELMQRLDGYPLALRLIAPRLKLRSPAMVLRELGSTPIAAALDDLPERHRDLSALIGGSVESLSASRQAVLLALTMFPSGATVEQLQDVLPEPELLDDLDFLVDQSLVTLDEGAQVRLRTLELVRISIRASLAEADRHHASTGFIRAMIATVRRHLPSLWGPMSAETLDMLDAETSNVHEALRLGAEVEPPLAAELLGVWWRQDLARGRYRYVLAQVDALDNSAQPELAFAGGIARLALGREAECAEWLERAISGFALQGSAAGQAIAHARLASLERRTVSIEAALNRAEQALKLAQASGLPQIEAECELTLGILFIFANQGDEAARHIRAAVEKSLVAGDEAQVVNAGLRYMSVLHGEHDFAGMLTELERLLPMAERLREPGAISFAHELRGRAFIGLGQPAGAEASFRESYRGWERLDNTFQMADQSLSLSRAFADMGRFAEAETWVVHSANLWMKAGDVGGLNAALTILARCWMARNEQAKAAHALGVQEALAQELGLRLVDSEITHRDGVRAQVGEFALPKEPATAASALALFQELPVAPASINSQINP